MYVQHVAKPDGRLSYRGPVVDLGAVSPTAAPFACPPCAYFTGSYCAWCPNEGAENIPDCTGCKDRQHAPTPWYKSSEFLIPLVSTVAATLVSAVLLSKLRLR